VADLIKSIISPIPTEPNGRTTGPSARDSIGNAGPSFKDALGSLSRTQPSDGSQINPTSEIIKFSNHAIERMRMRGIRYSSEQMQKIESAVQKAQDKGARETLLLAEDSAMIVNVPNRTVVTVMDKNALKENVFTNIDSTVMI